MLHRCKSLLALVAALSFGAVAAFARSAGPGTLNYIEGSVSLNGRGVESTSSGSVQAGANQTVATSQGKVEVLLTPGVFLRLGDHSSMRMQSSSLTDTRVQLLSGRAMVEATEVLKENNLQVVEDGAATRLVKHGLYFFNADQANVAVYDGEAIVIAGDQQFKVKKGHEAVLANAAVEVRKFDRDKAHDELFAWSKLRSQYLAEAGAEYASTVYAGAGWWYGPGWYWNPWWDMYSFIPGDGILYSPFGWPFYSPVVVYRAPGFYRGFYGGRFHTGAVGAVHGTPGVRSGTFGRAPVAHMGGGGFHGGFAGGGVHGVGGGGFHGGGGRR
ncbi:MAG TPA: hypothetical protein VEV17_13615 [Bryobacteraceae bacterium]|nr:hypothetical protein [Bryobacteraceae bacterium]